MAVAALVLVGSSAAYAGAQIGAGDIQPDAVRSKHVKDDSIALSELQGFDVGGASGEVTVDIPQTTEDARKEVVLARSAHDQLQVVGVCVWDYLTENNRFVVASVLVRAKQPNSLLVAEDDVRTEEPDEELEASELVGPLNLEGEGFFEQDVGSFSAISRGGDTLSGRYHLAVNADSPAGEDCTFATFDLG